MSSPTIQFEDFEILDIRVGKIIEVLDFERAKFPTYKLKVDFGSEIGIKQSSARFKSNYTIEELTGRLCMGVVNFEPRNIAGFLSEVLVVGVPTANGDGIALVSPDDSAQIGGRLY